VSVRLDIWSTYHYTCSNVEVGYVYPNSHRCRGITDILLKVVFNTITIHFSPIFLCYQDGLGGWKIVSVSVNNHVVCFEHKLDRITQDAIRITTACQ
jgi:hypothetical protein